MKKSTVRSPLSIVSGLLSLVCFLLSCQHSPLSIGKLREIVMVTPYRDRIEAAIIDILQNETPTPQPEPEFLIRWIPSERLKDFTTFRTLFIIGRPEDKIIRDMGEIPIRERFTFFKLKDLWARDQLICVFIAKDSLEQGLRKYALRIHHTFEENFLKRLEDITYEEGYEERLTQYLLDRYDFSIKVPKGFMANEDFKEERFIYIFGHNPDRSIFIYWEEKNRVLENNELLALRDSLTQRFYEGDLLLRKLTVVEEVNFLDQRALRIMGVWQNEEKILGGPFLSYCFNYDDKFFFIDGTLFLPGERKLNSLFQLKVVLNTFKVKG